MSTITEAGIKSATIRNDAMEELLNGAMTHACRDEALAALNAVRIWASDGRVYVAATDRFRLIEGWKEGEGEIDPVLIRLDDAKRILALVKSPGKRLTLPVTITRAGDMVSFAIGSDTVTVSSWEGNFPPYEHLFPTGEPVSIPSIQFNPAYFADYAKIAGKGVAVGVRFYGERKPIEILLGDSWRALLMPMRAGR